MSDQIERIRLGGLWKKESKGGTKYLSGELDLNEALAAFGDKFRVVIFANDRKNHENSPDYTAYANPDTRQNRGGDRRSSAPRDSGRRAEPRKDDYGITDDDIPF